MPDVMPDASSCAMPVLSALHVPPETASVSVMDDPVHTLPGPDITGIWLTVRTIDEEQLPIVYMIVAVPADKPVTFPDPSTVAIVPDVLQMPPVVASNRETEELAHTAPEPDIAAGVALTVTIVLVAQPVEKI